MEKTINDRPRQPEIPIGPPVISPIKLDALVRMETFTDHTVGTIICFLPVLADGSFDPVRAPYFRGQIQVNNQPVIFDIKNAINLEEAIDLWVPAVEAMLEQYRTALVRKQLTEGLPGGRG